MARPTTKNVKDNPNYHKEYYLKKRNPIQCECGGRYDHSTRARHVKTKRHRLYEEQKKIDSIQWERCSGCQRHELSCRCGSTWY
jgi:hypothetical protein